MALSRIAWVVVAASTMLIAAILLLSGYVGYSGVFWAVGLAAAVNLLPPPE